MVTVIADVGSNFKGDIEIAKQYIKKCSEVGVDIVKFQTYTADSLFSKQHPAYKVIKDNVFGLPEEWTEELKIYSDSLKIEFTSTPTDLSHIDLFEKLGIKTYKIASGDLTFLPLVERTAKTGKNIILSTGMANLEETKKTVKVIEDIGNCNIGILHCISNYPPKCEEVNLNSIKTLINEFPKYKIGFSDHSKGDELALAAVGMGAEIIEKHITLSKDLGTPDASFAMTVEKFAFMVEKIRNIEKALGNGVVQCAESEKDETFYARRGIYAKVQILKDEKITIDKLSFLRPAEGINVFDLNKVVNSIANEKIEQGTAIRESLVNTKKLN